MLSLEPYSGCSTENCLKVDGCSDEEPLRDRRGPWPPSAFRTPTETEHESPNGKTRYWRRLSHEIYNSASLHSVKVKLLNVWSYFRAIFPGVIDINV